MWGIKNTSNEIVSMHTNESDAKVHKDRLNDETLILIEDTKENLIANLKQAIP